MRQLGERRPRPVSGEGKRCRAVKLQQAGRSAGEGRSLRGGVGSSTTTAAAVFKVDAHNCATMAIVVLLLCIRSASFSLAPSFYSNRCILCRTCFRQRLSNGDGEEVPQRRRGGRRAERGNARPCNGTSCSSRAILQAFIIVIEAIVVGDTQAFEGRLFGPLQQQHFLNGGTRGGIQKRRIRERSHLFGFFTLLSWI